MSPKEYLGWQAFAKLHPFGEKRSDFRNAMLISSILKFFGSECNIDDFIVDFTKKPETEREVWERQQRRLRNQLMAYADQHNAFVSLQRNNA